MMMFGWDLDTWRRAFEWAGKTTAPRLWADEGVDELLAVRRKWLKDGGPQSGPVSKLALAA